MLSAQLNKIVLGLGEVRESRTKEDDHTVSTLQTILAQISSLTARMDSLMAKVETLNRLVAKTNSELKNRQKTIDDLLKQRTLTPSPVDSSMIAQAICDAILAAVREGMQTLKDDVIQQIRSDTAQNRPQGDLRTVSTTFEGIPIPPVPDRLQENRQRTINNSHSIPAQRAPPPPHAHSSDIGQATPSLALSATPEEIRRMMAYLDDAIEQILSAPKRRYVSVGVQTD